MEWIKTNSPNDPILPISVSFEERLAAMDDAAALEECKTLNTKSALPKCITTMRNALNLASFFTTGTDEVRQWTIRKNTKAPAAAGVIHTDFEKTFIQCIVYNFDVLKEYGDEKSVQAAGKVLTKGKDYGEYFSCQSLQNFVSSWLLLSFFSTLLTCETVVEDGDILLIKAGAAKA